ncbi:hypothetical protein ACIBCT_05195 [Streptosporangium sp. NPDC050855]|uniref:hypothetical protein n=1 Tax=Streptosporangium sp. NPDC050855 TaxID=3366194 RepID=UPI0037A6783D
MFRALSSRRIAVAVAGAALFTMTAACGSAANDEVCTGTALTKSFNDFTTAATGSAGDPAKFNAATAKLGTDLKAQAANADGDVAAALNDMATSFEAVKIDANDPAAAAAAMGPLTSKMQEASSKLAAACS